MNKHVVHTGSLNLKFRVYVSVFAVKQKYHTVNKNDTKGEYLESKYMYV